MVYEMEDSEKKLSDGSQMFATDCCEMVFEQAYTLTSCMLTTLPGPQGAILDTLREKLADELCVKEFPRLLPLA